MAGFALAGAGAVELMLLLQTRAEKAGLSRSL